MRGRDQGGRCRTALVLALALPSVAWALNDDIEIPLVPLAPPTEDEAVDDEMGEPPAEVDPRPAEPGGAPTDPEVPKAEPRRPDRRDGGTRGVFVWGGAYVPLGAGVPRGVEVGAAFEQALPAAGVLLRAELSTSLHRVAQPRLVPERGMDVGFNEVTRVVGARFGAVWYPLASGRGFFVAATAGAALDHTDRRVFSVTSRTVALRPTASVAAGLDVVWGPGRLRTELCLRGLHLPVGPEAHVLARAHTGLGAAIGYRIAL